MSPDLPPDPTAPAPTTAPAPAAPAATSRHGAHVLDDHRTRFAVWAPLAEQVELALRGERRPMPALGGGWFALVADAVHGDRYAYHLDGDDSPLPDPAARWLPEGVHGPAAVVDPRRLHPHPVPFSAPPITSAVIYELHIGTFTTEGTFAAATEHLQALVDLGVTHVEVMPVNAFDGARGWGYDGVAWHAVHQPYGGPEGFAAFVDAAHRLGLAVVLDVVHNHLGPSGNHLPRFGPYLLAGARSTWGDLVNLDGPDSGPVRELLIGNALMWLDAFRVDALRLDAVHALNDDGARHVLAEMGDAVAALSDRVGRRLELIAESDRNDPRTITPTAHGGQGMDAQWADDLHHAIHVAVTGEADGYYVDYADPLPALARAYTHGLVHDGRHSAFRGKVVGAPMPPHLSSRRLVACVQNHDQVGNRPAGDRLTTQVEPDLVRVAIALLCAAPHTPMLFMGEEHGETRPFQFFSDMPGEDLRQAIRDGRRAEFAYFTSWGGEVPDPLDPETFRRSTLDRDAAGTPAGLQRRALWTDLLGLRRTEPALGTGDRSLVEARIEGGARGRVLVVDRRPPAGAPLAPTIRLTANLGDAPVPASGRLLLSTADLRYGGDGADPSEVPPRTAALHALEEPVR